MTEAECGADTADGGPDDRSPSGATTVLATVAVVGGTLLAAAGVVEAVAADGPPLATLLALPLAVRLGVPLVALGAVHAGTAHVVPAPVARTPRRRRTVVAGALVAGAGAVVGALPVVGPATAVGPAHGGVAAALHAAPLVVGWALVAGGFAGHRLPRPAGSRVAGAATGGYDRVARATAGPFPAALRWGLLAAGAVVVGTGAVLARPLLAPPGDSFPTAPTTVFLGIYLLGLGGALAAIGAVLPGGSRLPAPAAPRRMLVVCGTAVLAVLPLVVPALIPLGSRGGGLFRLGTALVVAGLAWWAGAAVARRL